MEFTMKITPQDPKLAALKALSTPAERVSERKSAPQPDAASTQEPSTTVQLSAAAKLATQGADGSFDAEKVERMSQAIRDGSFKVNADAVADKLIANAREQLAKTYR
jgi:negative regulator of flagellin synthesis FlgM